MSGLLGLEARRKGHIRIEREPPSQATLSERLQAHYHPLGCLLDFLTLPGDVCLVRESLANEIQIPSMR